SSSTGNTHSRTEPLPISGPEGSSVGPEDPLSPAGSSSIVEGARVSLTSALDKRLEGPRRLIGLPRTALPTPSLILDLPKAEKNIADIKRRMDPLPAAPRPHTKIHKSPTLGRMQLEAGAKGLTTATVWEAAVMLDAGLSDVLIANQVVGPAKTAELARIAGL